jgi:imidazolonepropionase-like amidohydrolase
MFVSLTLPGSGMAAFFRARERAAEGAALRPAERAALEAGQQALEQRAENVERLLALGLLPRLVISSDAGPFDIEFARLYWGLELGVRAGLTPLQAIGACTRVAAEACGVLEQVGTLEAGKQADVLVVAADPLEDLANLRRVTAVFKAGQRVVG